MRTFLTAFTSAMSPTSVPTAKAKTCQCKASVKQVVNKCECLLNGHVFRNVAHQRAEQPERCVRKQNAGCEASPRLKWHPLLCNVRHTRTSTHRWCANSRRPHAAPPGGVCVDVVDLLALHARVLQRQVDAGGHAQAVSTRVGHVVSITGDGATQVLCIAQHKEDMFNSMHMAHGGVSRHAISRVIALGLSSCVRLQNSAWQG